VHDRCVLLRVDRDFEGLRGSVFETTFTDFPVVSTPYIPAAEIPIPCWPRCCFKRWNFEP